MAIEKIEESIPASLLKVIEEIKSVAKPKKLILFGSRARGNARNNSDYDFCIVGKSCSQEDWNICLVDLLDSPWTLYKFELVEFENLSPIYQKEILLEGKIIYEQID